VFWGLSRYARKRGKAGEWGKSQNKLPVMNQEGKTVQPAYKPTKASKQVKPEFWGKRTQGGVHLEHGGPEKGGEGQALLNLEHSFHSIQWRHQKTTNEVTKEKKRVTVRGRDGTIYRYKHLR